MGNLHTKWENRAEYVINAAGYRAAELGAMFGRDVPCISLASVFNYRTYS